MGYNVYVNNGSRVVVKVPVREHAQNGLNISTSYTIQVSANTSKGEGPRSHVITVWTDEDAYGK